MNLLLNWKTLLSIPLCLKLKHLGMNLLLENTSSSNSSVSEIEAAGDESTVETNQVLDKGPPTGKPSWQKKNLPKKIFF